MPNNDPCPTCTTQSAWGCPVHAPKHMEAAKPTGPLYDRILAALQAGPMVHNEEWIARQIAELVEPDIEGLKGQIEVARDYLRAEHGTDEEAAAFNMDPIECYEASRECKRQRQEQGAIISANAAKARLWDEVRPLLHDGLFCGGSVSKAHLYAWVGEHKSDLEAAQAGEVTNAD